MKKMIVVSLIVLLIGLVLAAFYDSILQSSLSEPELETAVSPGAGKEAKEDCGCKKAKNANHSTQNEGVRELPELTVETSHA